MGTNSASPPPKVLTRRHLFLWLGELWSGLPWTRWGGPVLHIRYFLHTTLKEASLLPKASLIFCLLSYPSLGYHLLLNSVNAFFVSFFSSPDTLGFFPSLKSIPWTSLGVQWLERHASTASGAGRSLSGKLRSLMLCGVAKNRKPSIPLIPHPFPVTVPSFSSHSS